MKKYILILIGIFILSLCGCNNVQEPLKNQEVNVNEQEKTDKPKHEP